MWESVSLFPYIYQRSALQYTWAGRSLNNCIKGKTVDSSFLLLALSVRYNIPFNSYISWGPHWKDTYGPKRVYIITVIE